MSTVYVSSSATAASALAAALQAAGGIGVSSYLSSGATTGAMLSVDDLIAATPEASQFLSECVHRIENMFEESALASPRGDLAQPGYAGSMPCSAAEVAAEIRRRSPGVGVKKLHKLLYYCQGHHLSGVGRQLFSETVSAWDMGPVVGQLWKAEKDAGTRRATLAEFDEAELNTIGYVLSRYGRLTARDLEHLTHGEQPWIRANVDRPPGGSARILPEWIRDYFRADEQGDEDGPLVNAETMRRFAEGAESRLELPAQADSVDRLRSRARSHD